MCPLCNASEFVEIDTEEIKIQCNTNNVGYRWRCLTCKEKDITKVYEGETGRSARIREPVLLGRRAVSTGSNSGGTTTTDS